MCTFTSFEALKDDARDIFNKLEQDDANQLILIYNLPKPIRERLDNDDRNVLDAIPFRFIRLSSTILFASEDAGASRDEMIWARNTTFLTGDKGKQPDDCFLGPSRLPPRGEPPNWPTPVIESGISESKLREDAKWWFQNSHGAVRTVITLNSYRTRKTIILEKWQLSHAGQPVTTAMAQTLDRLIPPMPPLGLQRLEIQVPFIAQEAAITPDATIGTLYLHFQALFDRAPGPTERDLDIDVSPLMDLLQIL
ncbi:uncharacterized protein CDV56_107084 [Aspergillus thermomutatus]|uniref:Uncharacterized protein n=1 Tax=Aspergillus thermomutatus TaxID=41047 RepID=A0A397GUV3_ASPTH|nr:uncharacterized protein CDV56_107084 [Aspergillus thermomutatus]RHZ52843.1 hypothetical protein CDV56_107084 [Aspergillus thermomutatus]